MVESTNSQSSFVRSSNNVISFSAAKGKPKLRIVENKPIIADEETVRDIANTLVTDVAVELLHEFVEQGFDIESTTFDKNFGFAMEAIRSTLYATVDIHHPFQEIVDKCVKLPYANDDEAE